MFHNFSVTFCYTENMYLLSLLSLWSTGINLCVVMQQAINSYFIFGKPTKRFSFLLTSTVQYAVLCIMVASSSLHRLSWHQHEPKSDLQTYATQQYSLSFVSVLFQNALTTFIIISLSCVNPEKKSLIKNGEICLKPYWHIKTILKCI